MEKWRTTEWGQEGRYSQSGLVFVSGDDMGRAYVRQSYLNVKALTSDTVEELPTKRDVEKMLPGYQVGADVAGGYVNWGSGWSNAEETVRFVKQQLDKTGRVDFRTGEVRRLISVLEPDSQQRRRKVTGVELTDGNHIMADLVILATGAWTGRLVDLRGRAEATGQVLSYVEISDEEQAKLETMPILLNFSTGIFIIPPQNNLLKVARHAYGYRNPMQVPDPAASEGDDQSRTIEISVPENGLPAPMEGQDACRKALRQMLPGFADRPFVKTRVCWYTDRYLCLPLPFLSSRIKQKGEEEERRKANPHHLTQLLTNSLSRNPVPRATSLCVTTHLTPASSSQPAVAATPSNSSPC
jgi:sarcosine oxidase/L-pipecolate oxidase